MCHRLKVMDSCGFWRKTKSNLKFQTPSWKSCYGGCISLSLSHFLFCFLKRERECEAINLVGRKWVRVRSLKVTSRRHHFNDNLESKLKSQLWTLQTLGCLAATWVHINAFYQWTNYDCTIIVLPALSCIKSKDCSKYLEYRYCKQNLPQTILCCWQSTHNIVNITQWV